MFKTFLYYGFLSFIGLLWISISKIFNNSEFVNGMIYTVFLYLCIKTNRWIDEYKRESEREEYNPDEHLESIEEDRKVDRVQISYDYFEKD